MLVSRALLGFSSIELLHQLLVHFQDSLSLDCYVSISRTFRILFHQSITLVSRVLLGSSYIELLRQYLVHFQDSLSFYCYISYSRTFKFLFYQIVTLVSRALLGFSFIRLLRQYRAHFQDFLSLDGNQYLTHFQDSLLFDCYVSISRTFGISCIFRILFHWIVTLVSRAPLLFSFIKLSRFYLVHFSDSLLLDCYVSIGRTFRIYFYQIVTIVSRALLVSRAYLGFSFIGLLRQYLAHLYSFLSLNCHVTILRTFRFFFFYWIVTLVSSALLGFSFIRW